jgi:8-oxo-dGTP pyrophosphatase MutT (NUDIX family)
MAQFPDIFTGGYSKPGLRADFIAAPTATVQKSLDALTTEDVPATTEIADDAEKCMKPDCDCECDDGPKRPKLKSILQHSRELLRTTAKSCGANGPGGDGFQSGNTCASGSKGSAITKPKQTISVKWQEKPTPSDFISARDNGSKYPEFLSHITPDDIADHKLFLSDNGKVGIAVSPDGDIQNVFNNGGPKGAASEALIQAINAGGKTLDCYDGHLPLMYSQFGFTETGRMKFNRDYAPAKWNYDQFGEPDVVFMARTIERTEDESRERYNDKENWQPAERSETYYEGEQWDEAKRASAGPAKDSRVRGKEDGQEIDGARAKSVDSTDGATWRDLGSTPGASRKTKQSDPNKWSKRLESLKERRGASEGTVAAGLAVIAKDTGRILLLQRALDETDPASGKFEFPGGHLEPGETPFDAAKREWEEETGLTLPKGKEAGWYKRGIYEAFFYLIDKESQLEINPAHVDREVSNPDDPKGEWKETAIWFDVSGMVGNKTIRQELLDAMNDVRQQVRYIRQEFGTPKAEQKTKSCGANAQGGGGFQVGNTCATDSPPGVVASGSDEWTDEMEEKFTRYREWRDPIENRLLDKAKKSLETKRSQMILTDQQRQIYAETFESSIGSLSDAAIERLDKNLNGVTFHANSTTLAKSIYGPDVAKRVGGAVEAIMDGSIAKEINLHLDGGYGISDRYGKSTIESDATAKEIYIHELAHVVDYVPKGETAYSGTGRLSDSGIWRKAWESEIDQESSPLSEYARTDHTEGFAEFGRLAFTDSTTAREAFPKSYEAWQEFGILSKEGVKPWDIF